MSHAGHVPMEELLAHHEWVSRLAHHLAGAAAEDVVQDVWAAALRSPPHQDRPPRPWLAQVVRNLVRLRWRDDGRRGRREEAWATEAPPQAEALDHLYERLELQRLLAAEVMALPEPLRTVVVLRFVEDLDATRIGEIVGAPAGTVRWRLKTALDRLRAAMDERCGGGRGAWVALLAPRALPATSIVVKGALLMAKLKLKTSLVVALLLVLLLGITGTALWRSRSAPGGEQAGGRAAPAAGVAPLGLRVAPGAPSPAVRGSVAGVVQDEKGNPVEGAVVLAGPSWPEGSGARTVGPAPPPTLSGRDGSFQVGNLPPGHYVATATKEGAGAARAPAIAVAAAQAVRGILLTLKRAKAGLSGRVVDSGGGGIPGARVVARRQDGDAPVAFAAVADDHGRYALPLPRDGYEFEASAEGYARTRFWTYVHLPMVREFRLHPASRVSGRVVSRPEGAPLPGAEVWLRPSGGGGARADDDGAFVLEVEPGSYLLGGRAGPFVGQRPGHVAVALAQAVTDVELVLARGRTIEGFLRTGDGEPAVDVAVVAATAPPTRARSDAQGAFRLEGLPAEVVELSAASLAGSAQQRVDLTAEDARGVKLVLAAGATVTGQVLDAQRHPVEGARIVAVTGTPPNTRNAIAFSDPRGQFRFDRLAAGVLSLSAMHESGLAEVAAGTLEVGVPKHVELVLGAGGSIAGTVRGQDGRPAAGALVFAFVSVGGYSQTRWPQPTAATQTATDGTYQIEGLPGGDVVIRAVNPGDDPVTGLLGRQHRADAVPLALRPGETRTGVDLIVLKNDLKIRGHVADDDGRPVAGAVLQALTDGVGAPGAQTRTLSQQDGQFVIDGLTAGPQTILAVHPDYAERRQDGIAAGSSGVEVRLQRAGALAGVVIGAGGQPAREYTIVGRPVLGANATEYDLRLAWSRPPLRARVSQADGAFTFATVAPGTYELDAYLPDKSTATLPSVTVAAGARKTDLRLVVQPGATIRGRAVDYRTARPVAGARAEGRGLAIGQRVATADASGVFTLEGLPAGKLVDFAIIPPRNDYLTDNQHRVMPAKGGVVDIGDVPLYPGSNQTLGMRGAVVTGLWFQSQEGRPAVYSVVPGSPGAVAGARPGDFVLSIDDTDVRAQSSSVTEGLVASAGRTIKLTLQSGPEARVLNLQRP